MPNANIVVTAAAALLACVMPVGMSAQSRQESQQSLRIRLQGKAQMVVADAVNGALRRLATATCQLVLEDFRDASARPLEARLEVLDQTVTEYVASVYFVDGDDSAQCRLNEATAAFTETGSRVIHVCAKEFARQFALRTAGGEILVIHELLHSLGLGENPPTSAQITDRVWFRCGSLPD